MEVTGAALSPQAEEEALMLPPLEADASGLSQRQREGRAVGPHEGRVGAGRLITDRCRQHRPRHSVMRARHSAIRTRHSSIRTRHSGARQKAHDRSHMMLAAPPYNPRPVPTGTTIMCQCVLGPSTAVFYPADGSAARSTELDLYDGVGRARPHCRFRSRGTESLSASGSKWVTRIATRHA
jgi:hypothetical protein